MKTTTTALLAVSVFGWAVVAGIGASADIRGSDIVRQWVVCQYVNSGIDPYALAKDILFAKYGAGNPERVKVYAIPKEVPAHRIGEVLSEFGPPEATYPPPAIGLLALTVGLLPDPVTVLWVWFAVNVAAAAGVAIGLTRLWPVPPGGETAPDNKPGGTYAMHGEPAGLSRRHNLRLVLAALLVFPPTFNTLVAGQFSLLVLGLLLAAIDPSVSRPLRGVALGVALLKPSLALPFLFLPLVRREWLVLLGAVAVQGVAAAYVAAQTGSTIGMFRDWLTVAGFFLQGMYTLQDWLNVVSPRLPWLPLAASLGVLALCGVTLYAARHLPRARLFSIAAVTSVFWTYHGSYDFVVLLPVLLPLAGWSDQQPRGQWSMGGLALFATLALALTPAVTGGDDPATRTMRWLARIVAIGLFVCEYVRAYRSAFRPNRTE